MGEPKLSGQIVYDTNKDYHESHRVGSTMARTILRSPAHAKYQMDHPSEPTPAQRFGIAAHCAILEPDLYEQHVAVEPMGINKRTKAGQMEYEAWLLENDGKVIVSSDQHRHIRRMMGAAFKNPKIRELLSSGHAEQSFYWTDPKTGVDCKCRPDFLREGHVLIDLKTTDDASYDAFQRKMTQFQYHFQASWYLDGVSHVTGDRYDNFIIIAIEKTPPYGVAIYELDEATIDVGRIMAKRALKRFAKCQESGHWPGYSQLIQPMNLTPWGFKEGDMHEFFAHAE